MPTFVYRARDESGKLVRGTMEASVQESVVEKITGLGYLVTSISEKKEISFSLEELFSRYRGIKTEELVMYILQLANMIGAGISLPNALSTLVEQVTNPKLKTATEDIVRDIHEGMPYSEALRRHPRIFSEIFANMVEAGEATGNLEEVLNRLAKFAEHEADIKAKLSGALTYPIVLTVLGIVVISYIVIFVIPSFVKIFKDSGVPLPGPTLFLYTISQVLRQYFFIIIGVIAAIWIGLQQYIKTPRGRFNFDWLKLRAPIWGLLIRRVTIGRFARTLATLLNSGVPLLQSLEIVQKIVGNAPIAQVIEEIKTSVQQGEPMSDPLKSSGEFPPMSVQMVAIGEETGTLDVMLTKIADFYDLTTEYTIKRVSTLLEPIFLIIIGGSVGLIFASLIMPIFTMVKTLNK